MYLPSNLCAVVSDWTTREHARLHGPNDSALSQLIKIRRASGLPVDHSENMPVLKARQHIARLLFKTANLGAAGSNVDFAGRYMSDNFKILAGWQVKKAVAQSSDQQDFFDRVITQTQDMSGPLIEAVDGLAEDPIASIIEESERLTVDLNESLETIADRARSNEDWGLEASEMTRSCDAGQIACCRMVIASVNYQHANFGSFDAIPVRDPATDAEDNITINYPFRQ